MANMGPVTVACPVCRQPQTVPAEVVSQDTANQVVVVSLDATGLRKHFTECTGQPAPATKDQAPSTELQQAHNARPLPAFIAPGKRACTGCGKSADECLQQLTKGRKGGPSSTGKHPTAACCGMCQDGNTHPSPGAQLDCQVWALEHGAQD